MRAELGLRVGSRWSSRQHSGFVIRLDRVVEADVLVTVLEARAGAIRPTRNAVRYLGLATLLRSYELLDEAAAATRSTGA